MNFKNAKIPNQLLAQTLPSQKRIVSFNDNLAEIPNLCGIMYFISKYKDSTALYWLQRISGKDGNGRYGSTGREDGRWNVASVHTSLGDPSITPISPDEANYSTTTVTESGRVFVRESWEDKDKACSFTSGFDHHRGHNHGPKFLAFLPMVRSF